MGSFVSGFGVADDASISSDDSDAVGSNVATGSVGGSDAATGSGVAVAFGVAVTFFFAVDFGVAVGFGEAVGSGVAVGSGATVGPGVATASTLAEGSRRAVCVGGGVLADEFQAAGTIVVKEALPSLGRASGEISWMSPETFPCIPESDAVGTHPIKSRMTNTDKRRFMPVIS